MPDFIADSIAGKLSNEIKEEAVIWRLVLAKNGVTLEALETTWSLDDVLRANAFLDMQQEYKQEKLKAEESKNKK